jgi:6-phosphogluconolactonase
VSVTILLDRDRLMRAAADRVVRYAAEAIARHGRFDVALAGGSTPERLYRLLGSPEYAERLDVRSIHLFFGDERCVPPSHVDSNYRMVASSLLGGLAVPPENVHRMPAELSPEEAASRYEAELERHFALRVGAGLPRFDLVLLGMGADGHTASLFPGSPALTESRRWVAVNRVPALATPRLTLTLPVLNAAARLVFLVAGEDKAERLKEVLTGESAGGQAPLPAPLPAQCVRPAAGELEWLVDAPAASRLEARA